MIDLDRIGDVDGKQLMSNRSKVRHRPIDNQCRKFDQSTVKSPTGVQIGAENTVKTNVVILRNLSNVAIGSSLLDARFSSTPIRMFSSQSNDTLQKSPQDTSPVASYPNPAQMNRIPSNANSTQSESDNLLSLKAFLRKQGFSDWNDFLAYRRRRHLLSRLFAFPFGLIPIPVFYSLCSTSNEPFIMSRKRAVSL